MICLFSTTQVVEPSPDDPEIFHVVEYNLTSKNVLFRGTKDDCRKLVRELDTSLPGPQQAYAAA